VRPSHDEDLELSAYLDGELDPMRALAFERRLQQEPELARRHRSFLNLRAGLRATIAHDRPSDNLRGKIDRAVPSGRSERSTSLRALAASVLVGAGLGSLVTWSALDRSTAPGITDYLIANHIRGLLAPEPIEVASSDRHTVKPWFASKVAQSPDVPDLSAEGFTLVGGRIDVVGREPVATIVYRRAQHLVSLTVLDASNAPPAEITAAGYRTRRWSDGGLVYVAISDLPDSDLDRFQSGFRAAVPK
jgi:anti-sigma factor RsiW